MIDYIIEPEQALILIWNRGETSPRDTIRQLDAMRKDPDYSHDFDTITDITDLKTDFSRQDIVKMAQYSETLPIPKGAKVTRNAIVAPADRTFGTSRMYEQLTNGFVPFKVGVFRDWASALTWIGKNPDALDDLLKAS
ncbi:hypothetical protein [Desulfoluna spongiiphila]|uniref:SpoIIAA-like n=1 Tax=Desulfoluna spongiiphila TaxID=419481 RepID=A0A1G5BIB1_9BACT|nr:hypothetical protein [Desulfoluna spongiiphila]SCX89982.1 hypothetical protein SAMN05216233_10242 [Desulfoluna spongiiphila]VVS93759.1 hypothetical protein DBB_33310 [Desulfoluna spongiiphila]